MLRYFFAVLTGVVTVVVVGVVLVFATLAIGGPDCDTGDCNAFGEFVFEHDPIPGLIIASLALLSGVLASRWIISAPVALQIPMELARSRLRQRVRLHRRCPLREGRRRENPWGGLESRDRESARRADSGRLRRPQTTVWYSRVVLERR